MPFADVLIDFPRLDVGGATGTALSQLYVVPVMLGWHFPRADVTFHYAFYAPTGRYEAGAPNNTSLGMWCNELSLRGTVFFDKARDWHASLSAFYDINGKKKDLDWTTGNPVTLMYGVGRNYGSGMLEGWMGVAGYAQWQVTDTTGADAPLAARLNKTTIYGAGPELTTLQGALTIRATSGSSAGNSRPRVRGSSFSSRCRWARSDADALRHEVGGVLARFSQPLGAFSLDPGVKSPAASRLSPPTSGNWTPVNPRPQCTLPP